MIGSTTLVTPVGAMTLARNRGYPAPEIADGQHGVPSDIFSYGVVSASTLQKFCCNIDIQVTLETFTGLLAYSEDRDDEKLVYTMMYVCMYVYL